MMYYTIFAEGGKTKSFKDYDAAIAYADSIDPKYDATFALVFEPEHCETDDGGGKSVIIHSSISEKTEGKR